MEDVVNQINDALEAGTEAVEVDTKETEARTEAVEVDTNREEADTNRGEAEAEKSEVEVAGTEVAEGDTEATENQIDEERMLSAIEAILFAMGGSVEISRIASVLALDVRKTKAFIKKLQERYERNDSGLMITQLEDAVQMCTKPDLYEYLIKIAKQPRKYVLSESVMETLSIIAYKQPVTKAEIEKIRGVSCDHAVNKLVEFDLVEEVGRMDAPGRPLLFGTTEQFLRSFGVQSLEDLPLAGTDAVETFREQAEQEAQLKLDI